MELLGLGLALLLSGLAFAGLALLLLRTLSRGGLPVRSRPRPAIAVDLPVHSDAVLLVQAGGRVVYANAAAREWFRLGDEEPDLETLSRRARPSGTFLGLCATEAQARFSLDGRFIEGSSYALPTEAGRAMLVSLRRPKLVIETGQAGSAPSQPEPAFTAIFAELSQAMTASLDLHTTLQTILESVERLIPSDYSELNLWDSDRQWLVSYSLAGVPGLDRRLEKGLAQAPPQSGYTAALLNQRKPLLVDDVDRFPEDRPDVPIRTALNRPQAPFYAYLGVPLAAAQGMIGTLELASTARGAYTANDMEILRILAGPAAAAIHNARLFEIEQQRALELAGLARLAQAAGSLRDPQDLFAHLVESIAPLVKTELLGFLIYDENRQLLQARSPFVGLPDSLVALYRAPILPGGEAEQMLHSAEALVCQDPASDPRLETLGLHHLAQAAGVLQTILIPLSTAGQVFGYLQAGDKQDGASFSPEDLRLLAIIAGQAAPIIANAGLVEQSQQRARRAEMLRRISSLASSASTLDEILATSLQDLAGLLNSDLCALLLVDENRGELRLHLQSLVGLGADSAGCLARLPLLDPELGETVTVGQQPYLCNRAAEEPLDRPIYQHLVDSLRLQSALFVPLTLRGRGLGEILLGSREPDFFMPGDVQTVVTAAGQLAGAIEQSTLSTQTDEGLRRRLEQYTVLARINHELNSTLDLEYLLRRVFEEALRTAHADCGSVLLFAPDGPDGDQEGEPARLQSPKILLQIGDPVSPGLHPLERQVLARSVTVVEDDFSNPPHPGVCSALVVPIAYQERIAGLIHLHATAPRRFDLPVREMIESLAVQAALAIGNAHRYTEQVRRSELLNRRVETISRLWESTQALTFHHPLERALEEIAFAIQSATPFEAVLLSVFDPASGCLHRTAGVGITLQAMAELRARPQPWEHAAALLQPEYRLGQAYFIPFERRPILPAELHSLTILPLQGLAEISQDQAWHPKDLLLVPLLAAGGEPLGLISVDAPRDSRRPDHPSIEALELFGGQAVLAIEGHRALDGLKSRLAGLESELAEFRQSAASAQEQLYGLQQKDTEQGHALRSLSLQVKRLNACLEAAASASGQPDRKALLGSLAEALRAGLGLDLALVAVPGPGGQRLLHVSGDLPVAARPETLLGQLNPLACCLQTGELMLVAEISRSAEWSRSPLLRTLEAGGFICLPLSGPDGIEAALLGVSAGPQEPFSAADETTFEQLSRQAAAALQRLSLLQETRRRLAEVELLLDFNLRLTSLEPGNILQHLAASARQVIPAAQAGLVVMWDDLHTRLEPQAATGYPAPARILEIESLAGETLPGQAFAGGEPLLLDEVDFARWYPLASQDLLRYRDGTGGRLPASSLAIPICTSPNAFPLGVLVLDNYTAASAFTAEDQAMAASLTQATALTLEYTRLYRAAEQRARQLEALSTVGRSLAASLQPGELISTLLVELESVLPYDTGTLWLRRGDRLVVQAARGFPDSEVRLGLSVVVEDSLLFNEMIASGRPVSAGDVSADPRFPSLVEPEFRSWLGVPLISGSEVLGVLALEKVEPDFYTPEQIQLASMFASQAAAAFENARLYTDSLSRTAELDQRSQRLNLLNRFSNGLNASLDLDQVLAFTLEEIAQAVHCSRLSAVIFRPEGAFLQAELPAGQPDLPCRLPDAPLFERLRQTLGLFKTQAAGDDPELEPLQGFLQARGTQALLVLPLATASVLHGLLLVHSIHPDPLETGEIDLARTIANQAALAIQNACLYAERLELSRVLEQRVEVRTAQLAREHHRMETLLRIITELSASLDLEQMLGSTLSVLNEVVAAQQVAVLILRPGENRLQHLASVGYTPLPPDLSRQTPFGPDEGLAGWIIQSRQPVVIADLRLDPRWKLHPGAVPEHRSAIGVPLVVGAETLGALLFFHEETGRFSAEQLDLIQAAAKQVGVAVNNAELYHLIRSQAEDLSTMLRLQQVEASRSRAILEAVADGVLVTDDRRIITLFNASAEKILGLQRAYVIGKSLEHFSGLFGRAAATWMEHIQSWSQDSSTSRPDEIFVERITLEDGRVVSVHLAPVLMRAENGAGGSFLGTVSTFHDITHQVEVDRLKSEFVATVSHELRTPLTSIKGYVELLRMGAVGALNGQQAHFLEVVKNNTDRLTALVSDLLDISRIEAGRGVVSPRLFDLAEVAESAVDDLVQRAQKAGWSASIELDLPEDLPQAVGDPERVRVIFENLLENACRYSPPGSPVRLACRPEAGAIRCEVRDCGVGIPPELQERVFERFYRGENPYVLATPGTGLGLSIVKRLVEVQGGRIWLESTGIPGEGSRFTFTLPLAQGC